MSRTEWMIVFLMIVLHVAVMIAMPGGSKLYDEEIRSLTGGLMSIREIPNAIRGGAISPHPYPFWIYCGILARITRNALVLHIPSMLMSVLIIILLVRLGHRHISTDAGLVAAGLYSLSFPLAVIGRRFAPDVGLLLFWLASFHFLLSGWRRIGKKSWLFYLVSLIAMTYWHYYGMVLLLIHWILVGFAILWHGKFHRSRERIKPPIGEALLSLGIALLVFVPWFLLVTLRSPLPVRSTASSAGEFYSIFLKHVGMGGYLGGALVGIFAILGMARGMQEERVSLTTGRLLINTKSKLPAFLMLIALLLAVPGLFSVHHSTFTEPFYSAFGPLVVFVFIFAAIGVTRLLAWGRVRSLSWKCSLVLFLVLLMSSVAWFGSSRDKQTEVEMWEQVVNHIDQRIRESDIVLVRPEEAQVYLLWAAAEKSWLHRIRGEEWLSHHEAGPNLERISTIWFCERRAEKAGSPERITVRMLTKVGGLDVGIPAMEPFYIHNVDRKYETSRDPRRPFTFSWALEKRAEMNFPIESNREAHMIILRANPFALPQKLTIDINRRHACIIEMSEGWRHYIATFPGQWLPGSRARFDFHFTTHRSFVSPEGIPWRMKAVAFDYVNVFSIQDIQRFPEQVKKVDKQRRDTQKQKRRRSSQKIGGR